MLHATMAHADAWNAWYVDFDNGPRGVPALRDRVDEACRDVGRDPIEVERTVAVLIRMSGGSGRLLGDPDGSPIAPMRGDPTKLADQLRAFAREGIAHVQLVLDPITLDSIRELGPLIGELERGG